MPVKTFLAAIVLAALAAGAEAATYDFTCSGRDFVKKRCGGDLGASAVFSAEGGPNVTVWAGSAGLLNDGVATLMQNGNGLGVNGRPDLNPWQLDGFPVGSSEFVTFVFAKAVNLVNIRFLNVDRNDEFDYAINGQRFVSNVNIGARTPTHALPFERVKTLVIRASGTPFVDAFGNDDFSIAGVEVAAVPLPAGGVLLLGAVAALASLRRRRG